MSNVFFFDEKRRRELGYRLIDHINEYFSSLPSRPVQLPAEQRSFAPLTGKMPELGEDATAVLDDICRELVDKGFHVPSGNYFGLMNPTPAYMAVLGEALVAALNPQLATLARSQLASKIEAETVRWIGERVGWRGEFWAGTGDLPKQAWGGTFTSGGNEANFSGLALALAWKFPRAVEDGVAGIGAQPVLYASSEAHHSLDKSAGLLGLGRKALRRIPINERVQLNTKELEQLIERDMASGHKPFCVVATAGTTNSGAIDDLVALSDICRKHDLWLHVDGAYGAAAIFSDQHRDLVRGIERADSITIDPHKWLAMPFAAGVILTNHPQALVQAFSTVVPYMPKTSSVTVTDNFRLSTQWSRRMNSLKLWLTLRVHGRKAYEEHIARQLQLANDFAKWVEASEKLELAAPQVLPIINLRLKMPGVTEESVAAANARVVDEVTRSGERWISVTQVGGRSVIRVMIISYLTGEPQLRALQQALLAAAPQPAAARNAVLD